MPFLLLLAWSAAVRLPFYQATDKDEFFFSVIAAQWLDGALPYVATFDVKPPGLFFIYAVAQALFGASQMTIKSLEILAIGVGAWALFAMLRTYSERLALWAAILFPIYTLALGGLVAAVMLIQLPFLILAFWALLRSLADDCPHQSRQRAAFLAGLAVGAAGMIKQTAILEAVALFSLMAIYGGRLRWRMLTLFVVGAAVLPLAFAAYFAAVGAFAPMFNAVVTLALRRADAAVAEAYGPEYAWYFTPLGATLNSLSAAAPLIFLWGGALFAVLRLERVRRAVPPRLLIVATTWLIAAFAGVVVGKAICAYYVLTMVPPLLILAGAFFCHGLAVRPARMTAAVVASGVAATVALAIVDREVILTPNQFLGGDFHATREVSERVKALGLTDSDRLLVLNRGYAVYTETGALPPGPYFHALHLLGAFNTPSADPLGETLAANARFVIVADTTTRHVTEDPARIARAVAYLNDHYRVAGVVNGAKDSFTIYAFVR